MADDIQLPHLKSKVDVDTTGLRVAEAEARASGASMGLGLGKGSAAAKNLGKDLEGMGKSAAGGIPILGGLGGSIGGLPVPALAAAAAIGGLAIAGKKIVEVSDRWEAAQRGLAQASQAAGVSTDEQRQFVEKFIGSNTKYVKSQDEVVDAYAGFIRQGVAVKTAQQDINLAMDLAAIKHISLTAASSALQKMEAGKGKALLDLGIVMKDYPVLMEDAHAASLKLEAAEMAATKATAAHSAALKAHGAHSAQAKATADALAKANANLAEAHSYASRRAAASAEVHDLLQKKLKGGRDQTEELTQVQNQLGNVWQSFAITTGPALTKVMVGAEKVLVTVVSAVLSAITVMGSWKGLWDVLGRVIGVTARILSAVFTVAVGLMRWEINAAVNIFTGLAAVLGGPLQGPLNVVKDIFGWVGDRVRDLVGLVQDLVGWLSKIDISKIPVIGGIVGGIAHLGSRAGGGTVVPGGVYRVGEGGRPETLAMNASGGGGVVIPDAGMGASPGGAGGHTFNLHVHGAGTALDPDANRRMLQRMAFLGLAAS